MKPHHLPIPSSIQAAFVHFLIQRVESGDLAFIEQLTGFGFSAEQIDRLRALPSCELVRLFREDRPLIDIRGNGQNLEKAFKALKSDRSEGEQQAEFIRRGASASMMHQLFRLSRNQLATFRTLIGVSSNKGRIKLPDETTQLDIIDNWHALRTHSNVRQRYLALQDRFPAIPLSTLYAIISKD